MLSRVTLSWCSLPCSCRPVWCTPRESRQCRVLCRSRCRLDDSHSFGCCPESLFLGTHSHAAADQSGVPPGRAASAAYSTDKKEFRVSKSCSPHCNICEYFTQRIVCALVSLPLPQGAPDLTVSLSETPHVFIVVGEVSC